MRGPGLRNDAAAGGTMPLVTWKEEYALGIGPLDYEHQDLFERINDLYDGCSRSADRDTVSDCLGRLHARVSAHFALEEKTMREAKNPHYAEHKAEHDRFLDYVTDAVADFGDQAGGEDIDTFARTLRDWLIEHITTYDRLLIEK
jgi:hemerythrin